MVKITVGVLALQGGFREHVEALKAAAQGLLTSQPSGCPVQTSHVDFNFIEVRNTEQLALCDGLIIPGGQSTTISFLLKSAGLLEPLQDFVKHQRKPTWGTCAGLILLAESIGRTSNAGPELIGGLDVEVCRNFFGRESGTFTATMPFAFLGQCENFEALFLDAPVLRNVRAKSPKREPVEILARIPKDHVTVQDGVDTAGMDCVGGIAVAVRQGNILGTSFHPELGSDPRVHVKWLEQVVADAVKRTVV
ncbi:hypothetical protein Q7P37_003631 [Cladosporium fusiforme]